MLKLLQKPGFLGFGARAEKPGFCEKPPGEAQSIVETRFLGLVRGAEKPGFFLNFGDDAEIIAETRFLGLGAGLRNRVSAENLVGRCEFS